MHRFLAILLFVLCLSMSIASKAVAAGATTSIYIRSNGLVDGTDKIHTTDNITYTFLDNVNGSIVIQKDNIILDGAGHVLQGSGNGSSQGIDISGTNDVSIENMQIEGFGNGIWCSVGYPCSRCNMVGNTLVNNVYMGIWLNGPTYSNNITGNRLSGNEMGIGLSGDGSYNTISQNVLEANSQVGIYLEYDCWKNDIIGNNVTENGITGIWIGGVAGQNCSDNSISGNIIAKNGYSNASTPYSYVGIYVGWNDQRNLISGNLITENYGAIGFSGASNNSIVGNNITSNEHYGIALTDSANNSFYHNNFINNTQQVILQENIDANSWDKGPSDGGNYWSDYSGIDSNHDGIGDTPYIISANNTDHYPLVTLYPIPEFPSFLILSLLIFAELIALTVYRRKHPQNE